MHLYEVGHSIPLLFYSSGVFPYPLSHSSSYLDFFGGQIYQKNVYFNDFLKKNRDTTILFRLNFIFLILWIMTVVCCCFWVLFHSPYCPSLELLDLLFSIVTVERMGS